MSKVHNKSLDAVIPVFDLQAHHDKVSVPTEFDLRDLARKYHVFPLKVIVQGNKRRLLLAMRNPFDPQATIDVEFRAGMNVIPVQADDRDIQWLIQTHYFGRKLSPSPSDRDELLQPLTHDVFEQTQITAASQGDPDWMTASLKRFVVEVKK